MTMLTNTPRRGAENAVFSQQSLRALYSGSKASTSKAPLVITEGVQPRVPLVRVDAGVPNSATSTFTTVRFESFDKTCQIKKLDACIAGKLGKLSEDNPEIRLEKTLIELASTPDDRARHSAHYELFALANACFQSPEKSIEMRLPVLLQHIATEVLKNLEVVRVSH